ncbi:Major Facilitator Superfamily protein [Paraburkholderia caffeinilytica]|uniref:Major facilitator superfamily (MFS) profile domain-containing protein n=1 Tax=Paraburkholderia caffeinilytica TaxID=1761016 RepID=A0ABQ1LS11_9BURK|nr:Major Facilitator Superfamily protein [Paraburkholderia caffeinilytica]GGC27365.1 hypothetical protein GCM10011400_12250 [Paraburkholderia caffeinilytica]CAB3780235.1 Sialic acid transporter NanT [Paraburkholderia caffeinilytica]
MGMPIAHLTDRFARPRIIACGIALWSLATTACGVGQNFTQMFVARMSVGVGEAALSPGTYSMLTDLFPKSKLRRAAGFYSLGSFIGLCQLVEVEAEGRQQRASVRKPRTDFG